MSSVRWVTSWTAGGHAAGRSSLDRDVIRQWRVRACACRIGRTPLALPPAAYRVPRELGCCGKSRTLCESEPACEEVPDGKVSDRREPKPVEGLTHAGWGWQAGAGDWGGDLGDGGRGEGRGPRAEGEAHERVSAELGQSN